MTDVQCKQHKGGAVQGRWPKKAIELVTEIIKNAKSNALAKGLELEALSIATVQVCFSFWLARIVFGCVVSWYGEPWWNPFARARILRKWTLLRRSMRNGA